jgi:hypothetical protein
MLKINGNDLLKINEILLKINKEALENLLKINRKDVENQQFLLKINIEGSDLLKINSGNVENQQDNEPDNSRVSSGFAGQKTAYSRAFGGEGGAYNNVNVTNNVTVDDVTCKINLKEKNIKKRKGISNDYSEDFEKFHKIYPNKNGKFNAWRHWEKYRKAGALPTLDRLIAAVELFMEFDKNWTENYRGETFIPMINSWIYGRKWEDYDNEQINKRLARKALRPAYAAPNVQNEDTAADLSPEEAAMMFEEYLKKEGKLK